MKRHPLDLVSLLCGLLFAGTAISLMSARVSLGSRHLQLVLAIAAVVLGIDLLGSGARRRSRQPEAESSNVPR